MSRILLVTLAIFLGGFLVCFIISIPLIAWAIREDNRENGIIQEKTTARDVGAISAAAIVLSLLWVLVLPLYGLMLLETIAGKGGKDDYGA